MKQVLKQAILFLAFAVLAFPQVISTTVGAQGTGYSTVPTVTASGGSCTTEPTFLGVIDGSGHLTGITTLSGGVGCTSPPTLAIGGPGTGATATTVLLPYRAIILSSVNTAFCGNVQPSLGANSCIAFQFACYIVNTADRVPFIGAKLFLYPGVSQITTQVLPPPAIVSALTEGVISEFVDSVITPVGTAVATNEALIQQDCANVQTNATTWNPYIVNGSTLSLANIWTILSIL